MRKLKFKSNYDHPGLTQTQRLCMTQLTRTGSADMTNKVAKQRPMRVKAALRRIAEAQKEARV